MIARLSGRIGLSGKIFHGNGDRDAGDCRKEVPWLSPFVCAASLLSLLRFHPDAFSADYSTVPPFQECQDVSQTWFILQTQTAPAPEIPFPSSCFQQHCPSSSAY